jgi:hypothetical protein
VPRAPLRWGLTEGPWFANALSTIEIDGRSATVSWEAATGQTELAELGRASLSAE